MLPELTAHYSRGLSTLESRCRKGVPQTVTLKNILGADFRSNPSYDLVLYDRLPSEQREILSGLQKDPDLYGILRPRGEFVLPIKSVCRETALLYLTLQVPGKIPDYVKTRLGGQCNQAIAELVLDGVLEIESNGTFACRSEVYALIYEDRPEYVARGTIARLSLDALRYAQNLEISDSAELSARLYFFNRLPVSPYWVRKFPSPKAVAENLGLENGTMRRFESDWSAVSPPPPFDGWVAWQSHNISPLPGSKFAYKLYVSPQCHFVREAFQATVGVLLESQAHHFKVGKDVYGLLRPDKIVAYFWSLDTLKEAAGHLIRRLDGCPAQGVPFTAQLTNDGLLSWGIDPPADQQTLVWQERESWRLWVTNRLATALLAAKHVPTKAVEPWRFALERLRLENVDTDTWTPTGTIWQDELINSPVAEG